MIVTYICRWFLLVGGGLRAGMLWRRL